MTRPALAVAGLACLSLVSAASAGGSYPTNVELVGRAVSAAVDTMHLSPPEGRGATLQIDTSAGGEGLWLVDSALKSRLIETGWSVSSEVLADSLSVGTSEFVLKIRIEDLSLVYARNWRRFLVFGHSVERVARASIFYDLVDRQTGSVLVASSVRAERRDVVPASELAVLSDPQHKFASPELEKSQWSRYVEGGLVLAIVGILVYLFYSNKTA